MPFQKGVSGNPKGRPRGALNKQSEKLKKMLLGFSIEYASDQFNKDFQALKENERVRFFIMLVKTLVKLMEVIDITNMTDREVDALLDRVTNKMNDNETKPEPGKA